METTVCICGAGTMGRGIAMAIARKEITVLLFDLNETVLSNAESFLKKELEREVEKKRLHADHVKSMLGCISFTANINDCKAPLIIEAIVESVEAKSALLIQLAKINGPDTLFATNTSSLSVTIIAERTGFPERMIGLHFFNPADKMKLIEIVKTKYNTPEDVQRMQAFSFQLGKSPVICNDSPGFIVNHVARPFYLEALRLAEQNMCTIETLDRLMESAGFKMGPFHLMDLIGNDINYTVSSSLYEALNKPERLKPSPLQQNLLREGKLGKKAGEGFFQYEKKMSE